MLKLISLPPFLLLFPTIRNCYSVTLLIKISGHLLANYFQHEVHGFQVFFVI